MNILVTGANGQLGSEIRIVAKNTADRYVFTDVVEREGVDTVILDITDLDAVRRLVAEEHIDVIVNCAAYTNVDAAESNAALAGRLNADAPAILATVMKECGGLLVHISTDYVFGKEPYNTPCREDRHGTPTGVYGETKLRGERNIIASGCRHVIIRTAWLYSEYGRNFCKTMLRLTEEKQQLKVVFDQCGTPTYAGDLAGAICEVLRQYTSSSSDGDSFPYGIYHYSNEGVCSWYDFTRMIAEYSGHMGCDIQPCHSEEYPSPVRRPSYSVLDKSKIKAVFGLSIPYWTDSLKLCINNILKG